MTTKISQNYSDKARSRLLESAKIKQKAAQDCLESILQAADLITNTFKEGNKVLICGNGGSAADAQHIAGEFVCALNKSFERPALPAIALTTDTSILTAFANDFHFDGIFERQIQALGKPNDLVIGISTSGNSKNIVNAIKMAKSQRLNTLTLTGESGVLANMADVAISVPSSNVQYIQETLLSIEHILCEIVEEELFSEKKVKDGN